MITARTSANTDHVLIDIKSEPGAGTGLVQLTLDQARLLRKTIEGVEAEIERRLSQRGEHPLY